MAKRIHCRVVPFALLLGLLAIAAPLWACDPVIYDFSEAGPPTVSIEVLPDCSFEDADYYSYDNKSFLENGIGGRPTKNFGNGRVTQRLYAYGCGTTEYLFFMDCTAAEAVVIAGEEDPSAIESDGYYVPDVLIRYIQPPFGAISIKPDSTAQGLLEIAISNGYQVSTNASEFVDSGLLLSSGAAKPKLPGDYNSRADIYDIHCGCRLFYPGSPGAGG